jgi:hypothetical protein
MSSLTAAQLSADTMEFMAAFSLTDVSAGDITALDGFGLKSSHEYRNKFLALVKERKLKSEEVFWIFMLCEKVKNKDRIVKGMGSPAFKSKMASKSWYTPVKDFFSADCVQYVSEVERIPSNNKKMPVVNIPTCYPSMASLAWLVTLKKSGKLATMTPDVMFETFCDNRWAAQMNVNKSSYDQIREKDRLFWQKTVKKSRNPFGESYESGWNESYFETKWADQYHFYSLVGGKIVENAEVMDKTSVVQWMTTAVE